MSDNLTESRIATMVYQQFVRSRGLSSKFWGIARKLAIKLLGDPSCRMEIHGRQMMLPLSHLLPVYLDSKPLYDRLPRKVSEYLMDTDGFVTGIDVGANIGDTIAAFTSSPKNRFLAIEPNPHFRRYLDENWKEVPNVAAISVLCSSSTTETSVVVEEQHGTARLVASAGGDVMEQTTLDAIIKRMPEFKDANVLKIDTDGYDLKILLGAKSLIESNKPAVLFECDAFTNQQYIPEFFDCMSMFRTCGYDSLLLYDNYGNFMGKYQLGDPSFNMVFENLLIWQRDSKYIYFDILLLPTESLERFHKRHHKDTVRAATNHN
jgi:FkbM family methyltransferase